VVVDGCVVTGVVTGGGVVTAGLGVVVAVIGGEFDDFRAGNVFGGTVGGTVAVVAAGPGGVVGVVVAGAEDLSSDSTANQSPSTPCPVAWPLLVSLAKT
jgi:hypothetical protein